MPSRPRRCHHSAGSAAGIEEFPILRVLSFALRSERQHSKTESTGATTAGETALNRAAANTAILMRIVYIACPTNLTLRSANAIQTYTTLRELRRHEPATLALVPRWLGEPSRFGAVGARHLLRPAVGKLSRLYRSTLWYYAERPISAAMPAAVVAWERWRIRPIDVVYVREVICAGWWATVWGRCSSCR